MLFCEVRIPEDVNPKNHFLFAHVKERLHCTDITNNKTSYTLLFSKGELTVRSDCFFCKSIRISRVFALVLLYLIKQFLQQQRSHPICKTFVKSMEMSMLRNEVQNVCSNSFVTKLFHTLLYHFTSIYGSFIDIREGYENHPPQDIVFFAPPLQMTDYHRETPILFYNKHHSTFVDFCTYDFRKYTTVLFPAPVYRRNINMIIRDYDSNLYKIHPFFQYEKAKQAKLSTAKTNCVKQYMFLLSVRGRLYEVLAIYPRDEIRKKQPKLPKAQGFFRDLGLIELGKMMTELNEDNYKHEYFDNLFISTANTYETITIPLNEWIERCVRKYCSDLEVSSDFPPSQIHFEVLPLYKIQLWIHKAGLQFLVKFTTSYFVYSQVNKVSDLQDCVWIFDQVSDEYVKVVRFVTTLRTVLHRVLSRKLQPVLPWSAHEQNVKVFHFEWKYRYLMNFLSAKELLLC